MKQIAFILIILLSTSCMTVKRIEKNCDLFEKVCVTATVDTVLKTKTVVVTERDTIINFYFPRDTVYLETPVDIPPKMDKGLVNSKLSYLEAGLAWSTAQVEKGVLKHYIESGDTILRIQLDNAIKERETLRTELKSSHKVVIFNGISPVFCIVASSLSELVTLTKISSNASSATFFLRVSSVTSCSEKFAINSSE